LHDRCGDTGFDRVGGEEMMSETKFQFGDKVRVFSVGDVRFTEFTSVVTEVGERGVRTSNNPYWLHPRQCELIERPKKTVKKKMYLPVFEDARCQEGHVPDVFLGTWLQRTKGNAKLLKHDTAHCIGTVELEVECHE
jgi:hypothetical protein